MDYGTYLRFVLALAIVLGLILGVAWLARRFGLGGAPTGPRRRRRLALIESLALDGKRRLVLVRRDGREHLLLVGGGADIVIERGLAVAAPDPDPHPEPTP